MKACIYGAGSLGTVLGAYITKNGGEIDLINRNKAHVEALNKNGAKIIGTVDVHNISYRNHSAELGYLLIDGETGKGYISEILPYIENTFFTAGVHRLVIECETSNIASASVAERNGYNLEGIAMGKVFGNGKYRDCKIYAKISTD